jgi:tetratricopeptide (TPR) repeat protein
LGSAHNSLGLVYGMFEHDWPKAEAAFRRAIELDSLEAGFHDAYAITCLAPLRRFADANTEMQRAIMLDPLAASVNNTAGMLLFYQGQFDRALAVHRQNIDLHPEFCPGYSSLAIAHLHAGHPQEALTALEKGIALCGRSPRDVAMLTWVRAALRDSAGMKSLLAELTPLANARRVSPYLVAKVHMARSDRNTALDWLDIAIREKYPDSIFLNIDPAFAELRSDPRFSGLVRKIGL